VLVLHCHPLILCDTLGAKLANIFSQSFMVEAADGSGSGKKFTQSYARNMSEKSEPKIEYDALLLLLFLFCFSM
jgi:hypothetical protein